MSFILPVSAGVYMCMCVCVGVQMTMVTHVTGAGEDVMTVTVMRGRIIAGIHTVTSYTP